MKSALLAGAFAQVALGAIEPKSFIFVVPDGLAPVSVTLARTYLAMTEGDSTTGSPNIGPIALDLPVSSNTNKDTWTTVN